MEQQHLNDQFWRSSKKRVTRKQLAEKVLTFLGKLGGDSHCIIDNAQRKMQQKMNQIRWDSQWKIRCELPLIPNKRPIQIHLDALLPKVLQLAHSSSNKQIRISACEFLHALLLFMIGRSAFGGEQSKRHQKKQVQAFGKMYARIFPVMLDIAADNQLISRQLFEPLVFQIVRWFASSRVYEHPQVMALLDAILQGSASKNNAQLRNLCARCVAQFAEWGLKQMSDAQIRDDPANIKSLVRRIQTHAVHPDPFKRLSALLCFGKLIPIIRQEDALIDNFILEIADCVLLNLKTSGQMHSNMGVSAFNISEKAKDLIMRIKRIILHKINLLLRENERRNIHQGLQQFLQFLLQRSVCSIEQDLRVQSQKLWEQCVTKLQQKKIGNKGGEESLQRRRIINAISNGGLFRSPLQDVEDDQQDEQQAEQRRKRNLFNNQKENQPLLSFQLKFGDNFFQQNDKNDKQEQKINPDQNTFVNLFQQRNARKRKVIDKFRAQLQVIGWIVERNYLSLKEIATQDKETYSRLFQNIISFVRELRSKLVRTKQYPNAMIKIDGFRQEEAQSLIRSTYYSILQLYRFFISLSDKQLEQTILIIHNKVKDVDDDDADDEDEDNDSPPIKKGKKKLVKINIILELSLNILLTPHLLGLELMMSQRSLERQLRNMVYKFMVKCLKASISNFTIQILSDFVLHSMTAQSLSSRAVVSIQAILDMPPNRFTQLCLGYLKLFELVSPVSSDYQLISLGEEQYNIFKEKYEGEWLKNLTVVCQDLIMHPSPGAQQKGRDLMKFIGKSMLPFDVLINWLTQKPIIFQRSADILLNYVASAWADQDYSLANKLFAYTAGQLHVNLLVGQQDNDQQQEKNYGYQRGDEDVKRRKPNVSRRIQMLPLFIPFIQRLQSQHPLYCVKFWQIAPQFWNIQN